MQSHFYPSTTPLRIKLSPRPQFPSLIFEVPAFATASAPLAGQVPQTGVRSKFYAFIFANCNARRDFLRLARALGTAPVLAALSQAETTD